MARTVQTPQSKAQRRREKEDRYRGPPSALGQKVRTFLKSSPLKGKALLFALGTIAILMVLAAVWVASGQAEMMERKQQEELLKQSGPKFAKPAPGMEGVVGAGNEEWVEEPSNEELLRRLAEREDLDLDDFSEEELVQMLHAAYQSSGEDEGEMVDVDDM